MSGFATDTTIDTVIVHLPDERKLRVTLTRDGVNDEPTVEAELDGEYLAISHEHTVLIDGVQEGDEDDLAQRLIGSCTAAWTKTLEDTHNEIAALEAAAVAVEEWLTANHEPRAQYAARDIAIEALALTPAELQSFEHWCPGHGDDEECEIENILGAPCAGCRDQGYRDDNQQKGLR